MRIRFFGPFERLIQREVRIQFRDRTSLRDLVALLRDQYEALAPYLECETGDELSYHIMFVKDGKPLKLDDCLDDHDTVKVLLPVTGG